MRKRDKRGRFAPAIDPELEAIQCFVLWGIGTNSEARLRALQYLVTRLMGQNWYITNR